MVYYFSPKHNSFYPELLKDSYISNGSWPFDAIAVSDGVFSEYTGTPPDGKERGAGVNGLPTWIDIPTPTNSELLSDALSDLSNEYKIDTNDLNVAYLAAIVSDGPSEITKQQIVREKITQRKTQYAEDIATAKEKYPV